MPSKKSTTGSGNFEGRLVMLQIPFKCYFALCQLPGVDHPIISRENTQFPLAIGHIKRFQGRRYRCIYSESELVMKGSRSPDIMPVFHFEASD
jgi:hypothetical protein